MIVYCKSEDRRRTYLNEKFGFLGYTLSGAEIEESPGKAPSVPQYPKKR